MRNPVAIAAIGLVVLLPVVFTALGGSRGAGLAVGVVLVVGGLIAWVLGARESRDGR